jgi:hypothetical protein
MSVFQAYTLKMNSIINKIKYLKDEYWTFKLERGMDFR